MLQQIWRTPSADLTSFCAENLALKSISSTRVLPLKETRLQKSSILIWNNIRTNSNLMKRINISGSKKFGFLAKEGLSISAMESKLPGIIEDRKRNGARWLFDGDGTRWYWVQFIAYRTDALDEAYWNLLHRNINLKDLMNVSFLYQFHFIRWINFLRSPVGLSNQPFHHRMKGNISMRAHVSNRMSVLDLFFFLEYNIPSCIRCAR